MPHITIEYSSNVEAHHDVQALVDIVHGAALQTGLPAADALRTRATNRSIYNIADGDPNNAFVAITARMAPGRSPEAKSAFLAEVLDAAETHIDADRGPLAIAWSIEITETNPEFRINRNHVRTRMQEAK